MCEERKAYLALRGSDRIPFELEASLHLPSLHPADVEPLTAVIVEAVAVAAKPTIAVMMDKEDRRLVVLHR